MRFYPLHIMINFFNFLLQSTWLHFKQIDSSAFMLLFIIKGLYFDFFGDRNFPIYNIIIDETNPCTQ